MTDHPGDLAHHILERAQNKARFIVAIAGPPGAGKSTLADQLGQAIRDRGESAEVLPMDGFHMDNGVLRQKGLLTRKGAPETFDVRGFIDVVRAVGAAEVEVLVPVFDRSRELAVAAARTIPPTTRFILVEGNYLLLDQAPWSSLYPCFDLTIAIHPGLQVLHDRLMERWRSYGFDEDAALAKTEHNDMRNAHYILQNSRPADILLST
jgi:pantothenate kinase